MKRHAAHDRLLALKLQGANHLARVLETHPDEAVRLRAAMALARIAIPALPASAADDHEDHDDASTTAPPQRPATQASPAAPRPRPAPAAAQAPPSPTLADISRLLNAHTTAEITSPAVQATVAAIRAGATINTDSG